MIKTFVSGINNARWRGERSVMLIRACACATVITVLLAVTGTPLSAAGGLISEIRFERVSPGTERVLFHLNGFYPPEIFALEGHNERLVCDFYDTEIAKTVERTMDTGGDIVTQIRIGRHVDPKQMTRVVLHLVSRGDFEVKQRYFSREQILAVSVTSQWGDD